MPRILQRIPFTAQLLPAVQGFYCGDEPWEREASEWIKGGPGGVLDDMARGCEVWLYATPEDGLVGFGSLAPSRWRWPTDKDKRVPISIIPMVGIQRQFWGQPSGPGESRFSEQILDHLTYEAMQRTDRHPLLGLMVHTENKRAIRLYEKSGFVHFSTPYRDKDTGSVYSRMLLNLSES